ncbi:hypothetical protein [Limosilactobacillus fermentum]|uniref:Uncharacterized protein n=1 Tax=Limosilactobacillus fermentum TaxID=1613 RepID=A0A1L7GTD5_LIMFE|nr:hypothetical protein [Limosilactobacillus fermentum]APU45320.1 hypothetical protein BUW47_02165 [Limosilactobacillus fermentum]
MNEQHKIISMNKSQPGKRSGSSLDISYSSHDNNGRGDGKMNDKFVTHTELELSNEKLLRHIDEHFKQVDDHFNQLENKMDANKADTDLKFEQVNTKFEEQKVWLYGTAIGIVTATCTIVGFLIHYL